MTFTPDENKQLERVSKETKMLEAQLQKVLLTHPTPLKWRQPEQAKNIVAKLRQLGVENRALLYKYLKPLLAWPNADAADPTRFYNGKHDPSWDRGENWFGVKGFDKFEIQYTFSNTWDKVPIKATFLVPQNLKAGDKAPIVWFFHGGGFCTGASDHIPWYSQTLLQFAKKHKAIIIAPNYPLGPEANYKDIVDAIQDFLTWYKEDGFFPNEKESYERWTQWLTKKIEKNITIDKDHVFVEGESAGGFAAVVALWLNAENKESSTKLNIDAALLRYPMIKHYKRDFPGDGKALEYMGNKEIRQQVVRDQANKVLAAVNELEKYDLVPTRTEGFAPEFMAGAFLLSMTQKWQPSFQRRHGPGDQKIDPTDPDFMDCVERVKDSKTVLPQYLPPIIMYHGHDDTNCPFKDTEEFMQALETHYSGHYVKDKRVFLDKVTELESKKAVKVQNPASVGHGFDYYLDEKDEPFLERAYHQRVGSFWPKGA